MSHSRMTVGIVGGGQLGLYMGQSAKALGHRVVVLDPDAECVASVIADEMILSAYDDPAAFEQFVEKVDVATYEFENVDAGLVKKYQALFPQKAKALRVSQHRFIEKEFVKQFGIATPTYQFISRVEDGGQWTQFPMMLKRCRFGYDGKGQWKFEHQEKLLEFLTLNPGEYIAEAFLTFDYEMSTVVTRFFDGVAHYTPFINVHQQGILDTSKSYLAIKQELIDEAISLSVLIARKLDMMGTMAVEWFVKEGRLYFNEMAPRPHNSGHATLISHDVSQFDQHIAAITGQRMVQPCRIYHSAMVNLIGEQVLKVDEVALKPYLDYIHLCVYGKKEILPNRKMGHITFYSEDVKELETMVEHWRKPR